MNPRFILPAVLLATLLTPTILAQDLESAFKNPPDSAKPHTWWHWMNGNITKEGITADLEAMKQVGLGGAQIFNVSEGIPTGPILFMSPEFRGLVKHAAVEANRLGIELCIHQCAGWSSSGGPWTTPENAMQRVVFTQTQATGPSQFSAALPEPEKKEGFYRDIAVLAFPTPADDTKRIKDIIPKAGFQERYGQLPQPETFPPEAILKRDALLDLTSKLGKEGHLVWEVPAGEWTILRFGYTPTGAVNAPSPDSGRGLEVDKFSRAAFDSHWAGMMGPILKDLGPLAGKTVNNCLIDSYEVGHQNWTPKFREEFKERRGYDPLNLLPVMTGRVVDSSEVSERFLWDFRRTIADLFADNYFSYFAEICKKNGMLASIEPYDGPFECMLTGRDADIPMGEFWIGSGESNSCKLAASVAHVYGRKVVGAEAFTAVPSVGRWLQDPYSMKSVGDLMYSTGINRYIIHRYAHQPWLDKVPGMTMGQWGTHFERTITWWKQAPAWTRYLARCQYMLQQGLFSADICYFTGEAVPSHAPHVPAMKAKGYDYDACNADVLLNRMSVKNGRLTLPDGMSYAVLVLPDSTFMTPKVIEKLRDLVKAGATIIGPRPEKSPSLADLPDGDGKVKQIAAEVWGDCDGKTVKEHVYGAGRVNWGRSPEEVLADKNIGPDCQFAGATKPKMAWIHRVVDGADVYFVSSQKPRSDEVECSFRVTGKAPELWHADTGASEPAPLWSEKDGRTVVPIRFDPSGSVFVVFRKPAGNTPHFASLTPPPADAAESRAPKIEIRKAMYEAIDGAGGADVTAKVADLVAMGETSIPATNANFGDPTYQHRKRLRVEYTLDGKPLTRTADENDTLELGTPGGPDLPPTYTLATLAGKLELHAFRTGAYKFDRSEGKSTNKEVMSIPAPVEITGPWTLRFPPKLGAPPTAKFDRLISWTEHSDAGIKYFSGTAEYEKEIDISQDLLAPDKVLYLDLGPVKNIAEVTLNGKDLGVMWKPPFTADISSIAKPGKNTLKVRVTNLWPNRLIGDEQFPDDAEWKGMPLKEWPQWLSKGEARPSKERITFTTWKHYTKDSQPLESGLLGPVMLRPAARITIE